MSSPILFGYYPESFNGQNEFRITDSMKADSTLNLPCRALGGGFRGLECIPFKIVRKYIFSYKRKKDKKI